MHVIHSTGYDIGELISVSTRKFKFSYWFFSIIIFYSRIFKLKISCLFLRLTVLSPAYISKAPVFTDVVFRIIRFTEYCNFHGI
jgi:hypothetical protein